MQQQHAGSQISRWNCALQIKALHALSKNLHRKGARFHRVFFHPARIIAGKNIYACEATKLQAASRRYLHDPLHPHWHLTEVMNRLLGLPFLGFQPDICISPQICSAFLSSIFYLTGEITTCQNSACPLARVSSTPKDLQLIDPLVHAIDDLLE